ncbi:hypothetical protein QH639_22125 [Lysinibacillus sp. 1 U-2021]|uniref:hypothetical protein n=1 Tax=Lysinibacillus sp. 1 U-2021 TaxID=3039426 RepID=UPI002480824B|nr:hypothetical protein [Lysinibacillus sp. 1 U-2021]WGT38478.1 hypothetical protein QH639_22125 [Lysinibacillus sp. 1 U-2021]
MKKISLGTLLFITIGFFLIALYALIIQVFGIQSEDKATIISGVLSMVGGALGAFGAYKVAVLQTTKAIEHDREIRIREKKVEKLEELKTAFVSCHLTLEGVYKKVYKQNNMIRELIEKCYKKGYAVFYKENFITPDIENEFIKGVMQLQSFKMIVMNNKEYLPVRMDSLEVLSATQRMINVLDDLINMHKPMIGDNAMKMDEFKYYWTAVTLDFQKTKEAIQKYISDPKKYIDIEIQENL